MAKYLSNRQKNLKVGIVSYTESNTVLEVTGKVGIGTTNATSALTVTGDGNFTGVVTANSFSGSGSALTGIVTYITAGSGISINQNTGNVTITATGGGGGGGGTGVTIQDEGSVVGVADSITTLNFVGANVSATASGSISTITIADNLVGTALSISGISTFTNGPVLVGTATSTGTASQPLQVTGGAYISGNTGIGTTNPVSKLDVRGDITLGTSGINTISSTTDIQSWYYTNKSFASGDTSPQAIYVGAAGTALYVAGNTANTIFQYTLSTPYDVSTAGAATTSFLTTSQESVPTGIDFHPNGTKMFLVGQSSANLTPAGDYVHEYSLSTPWNVSPSSVGYTTSYNVTEDGSPVGVAIGAAGTAMYMVGGANDTLYQYTLTTPYSLAAGNVTYANKSLVLSAAPLVETGPQDLTFNSTGTVLWIVGSTNDRIYEFRLGTAWDISTAVFYDDVYIGFNETAPLGLHVIPEQNVAYIVGSDSSGDRVFQYSTNTPAIEIASSGISSVSSIVLNNETRVKDKLYVKGNTHIDGNIVTQGTLTVDGGSTLTGNVTASGTLAVTSTLTASGAVTFDTTTSNINQGTSQTTGTFTIGGTTTATGTITVGRGTTTQTTNIQAGATVSGQQKTINLGTGGLAGSRTLITVGSAVAGAASTVTIPSPTNLLIGTATTTGTASQPLQVTGGAYVSGNLGVGVTNPSNSLTVYGTAVDTTPILALLSGNTAASFNNGAQIAFGYDGTATYQHFIQTRHNSANSSNAIDFYVSDGTQNNTLTSGSVHTMSLVSGSVGINSTSPTSRLDVVGDAKVSGVVTATTFVGQINAGVSTISVNSSTDALRITQLGTGNALVVEDSANPDASPFVVNASGSVGIGTTNPQDTLDVGLGTIRLYNKSIPSRFSQIYQDDALTFKNSSAGDDFNFLVGSTTLMKLYGSGPLILPGTASLTGTSSQLLQVTGGAYVSENIGIGTTNPTSKLSVVGDGNFTGVVTATTFFGALTGTATTASSVTANSVGLGTDTYGDYVKDITGTANQITVTSGTGEGSSPTLSVPNQFTAPQDVTVTRDLQVNRDLNVNGNITIGGTSATLFSQELKVFDPDIVLGFRTDANNNDVSTDNTANHGGIAIASTEGTPLISLYDVGVGETNPATYKKFMWFKSGTFSGLGTDAWLSNYAIGIGSTQVPNGVRLAAGGMQVTDSTLSVPQLNISGVSTFTGAVSFGTSAYFGDNDKLVLGDDNDLEIYHNGSNSIIKDAGTGILVIGGSSAVQITNANLNEFAARFLTDGAVELYYDNTKEFETTGYGATVYGTLESQGLNVSGITTVGFITATNIWNAGITTSSRLTLNGANDTTTGGGQIYLNGTTGNRIDFNTNGAAAPTFTTRSAGTKIVLYPTLSGTQVDYAIGITGFTLWSSIPEATSSFQHRWYAGTTQLADLKGSGELVIGSTSLTGTASQRLQVTGGAYISGSVGIGTTNPTSKLDIIGDVKVLGVSTFTNANNAAIQIRSGASGSYTALGIGRVSEEGIFAIASGAGIYANNAAAGDIVIRNNNASGKVLFTRLGANASLAVDGDNVLVGTVSSTGTASQRLQVTGGAYVSGSVGIGTTNPTSTLSVVGDGNFTGVVTATSGNFSGIITSSGAVISGVVTATSFSGSGTNLTGIVTSIVAGTNITISGSTGQVTINSTATGGGAALDILEVMLFA